MLIVTFLKTSKRKNTTNHPKYPFVSIKFGCFFIFLCCFLDKTMQYYVWTYATVRNKNLWGLVWCLLHVFVHLFVIHMQYLNFSIFVSSTNCFRMKIRHIKDLWSLKKRNTTLFSDFQTGFKSFFDDLKFPKHINNLRTTSYFFATPL